MVNTGHSRLNMVEKYSSLSVGHYELCRDDIGGIYLEAPIISD